jgi:peptidase M28-like protein
MEHVRAIAQCPRPSGSAEHRRVRQYLIDTLGTLGLETQTQETTGVGTHNAVAARVVNVLARLPGRNAGGPAVLLIAHYDGVPAGPGAGDDAAAVAALLEVFRALRAGPSLAHDVMALFSDGEEAGLTGSAAFVREHSWARRVAIALNFEGRGTGGPSSIFETAVGNLDAVRVLSRVPGAMGSSLSVTVYRALPNDTDLSELVTLGRPALNFGFADGLERYHTSSDSIAYLDAASVQHHGVQALALARVFADGPLPRPRTGDAVFFSAPGLGLIVYPEGLAMPLGIAAGALVLVLILLCRPRDPCWVRNVSLGAAGVILSAALAGSLAFAAIAVLGRVGVAPPLGGAARSRGVYAAGITMLSLASASAGWTLVRRWANPASAQAGALLTWTIAELIVTWRLPGASFLFVWPLLAAAGAALVARIAQKTRARHVAVWTATLLTGLVVVPTVYPVAVVILGMSAPGAAIIGLVVPLSAWLLAPHLETLKGSGRWGTPGTALLAAVILLAIGATAARPSAAHPEPSMLAYAYDVETSRAWFVTLPEFAQPASWSARALGPSARIVIPQTRNVPGDPPAWLTRAIGGESPALAVPAPHVEVGAPDLTVMRDSRVDGQRRVELRVRPAPGTYSIRLRAVDTPVLSAEVDGRAIDQRRYRTRPAPWTLGYVVPPADGFALALVVPHDKPLELDVIARSLGLPRLPGAGLPGRPEYVVPIHAGDQTVVHRRIRL